MKLEFGKKMMLMGSVAACACLSAVSSRANMVTFVTPNGAATSGPVDASATFTTSANTLTISLTDLQANPTDVAQLISDLDFVLSSGQTLGILSSSSGIQRTVNGNGTYSIGSTVSTGWGLNNNVSGGLQLDALGYVGPAGLIIGDPDSGGLYSNANGSIAGNKPHNPFLYGTATFDIYIQGLTADDNVINATFSFGTTAGVDVAGQKTSLVPDGSSTLILLGLAGLGLLIFTRKIQTA